MLARHTLLETITRVTLICAVTACASTTDATDDTDDGTATLPAAYADFNQANVKVTLSGGNVVIETNGYPDHSSSYWRTTNPLYVAPTNAAQQAPGKIEDFSGKYTLTVKANPTKAATSTATGLGAIGIARSGAMIYNDQEGPNVPLANAIVGFDASGAHTGPQSYHYHLEPKAWSNDDNKLIGVMADGFFLYGRRDRDGSYPSDLDVSGGHTGPTIHNAAGEYHYHIKNERYLNTWYILFPENYQGTPSAIR
jgi:hypothetical protein